MRFFTLKKILFAALALFAGLLPLAADEARWLLVFNTSAAMKKRLPAVEAEIKTLLTTEFGKNLGAGDSLGVWTFSDKLHTGQFPLTVWEPEHAAETVSNLVAFLHRQSYSGATSLGALQPTLNNVIADSERLTIVIVCDGDGEFHWTPYDNGLNETIKNTRDERKSLAQPYVVVLRTQLGKFIGATVNFPPRPASLTAFPILPREARAAAASAAAAAAAVAATNVVVLKPPPVATPLIIVGTHVSTNLNDVPKPPPATNPAPVAVQKAAVPPATNRPPVPVAATMVHPAPAASPVAPATNAAPVAPPPPAEDHFARLLVFVAGGIIVIVVAMVFVTIRSRRAPTSSLITSSLEDDSRPPRQ
jgi:hypothetical protein